MFTQKIYKNLGHTSLHWKICQKILFDREDRYYILNPERVSKDEK